jgi:hypothetical protein
VADTPDLIDRMVEEELGLDTEKGDTTKQREQCRRWINAAAAFVWLHSDWPWSYSYEDVSIAAGEDISIADGLNMGQLGGVFFAASAKEPPLNWVHPQRILQMRQSYGQTGKPRHYSMLTSDGDGGKNILLYPINDATRTMRVYYRLTPPDCQDSAEDDYLAEIPDPWGDTVVYEWAVYYAMKKAGNIQSRSEQLQLAQQWLASMVRQERLGREAPHNLAPYGVRGSGSRRVLP